MRIVNRLPMTEEDCDDAEVFEFQTNANHGITDDDLSKILHFCPNLQTVDFTGIPDLSDRTLVILAQTTTALRSVDISGCKLITDVGVLELAAQANRLEVVRLYGVVGLTDPSVSALVRSLSRLVELDAGNLPLLTSHSVRDIWTFGKKLRKVRLNRCGHVDDKGCPTPVGSSPSPAPSAAPSKEPHPRGSVGPGQQSLRRKTAATTLSGHSASESDRLASLQGRSPAGGTRSSTWLDAIPPLVLPSYHVLEHLHSLDLTQCRKITDAAVAGIVAHAPRLQHVHLAGCPSLTNVALEKLCTLGLHLETLTLSHAEAITDAAILDLTRLCPKLAVVEVSYCSVLTDLSVLELAILPNLRRLSINSLPLLTDISLLFLAEHAPSLVHLQISHCVKISLTTVQTLLRRLTRLEHFIASGIKSMARTGIKRFSEPPPPNYDAHRHGPYRVFKGENIAALRRFLDKEEQRRREAERRNVPFIPRGDDSMDLY